jgi:ferredoxin
MKAKVDRETCIGCSLCVDICPAVFKLDDDSIAIVLVDEIPAGELTAAQDAESQCPVEAITIK